MNPAVFIRDLPQWPAGREDPSGLTHEDYARADTFRDRVQGDIEQSVERDVGDFIVCRTDGQFAYQLAVVVDDASKVLRTWCAC